ncbi:MAG TPA: alpha/beta hydrolase [Pirellulales bacterium]|jgi:pimeloyl-ACP methyl ester carboxylesterase|nr:alpha/beta hydrolase [Pirellulales bacterium]
MAFLTAPDGVRLHYRIEGEGPPLILHAGAGCDSELWRVAGHLEPLAKGYRCVLFDHRGHGLSDKPRGAEANHINRYVADVVALLDQLGLKRAAFWGYSNGSSVGLKVAQDYPTRIEALIGSDGMSQTTPAQVTEIVARRVPEFREYGWERLIARFTEREPDGVPDWMKQRIRATDIQQFIDWLLAWPDWNWSEWESLPHIAAPTLLVAGELEDPEDETGKAASLMPNGTRMRVNAQGHINAFIKSPLVLPQVTGFLARHAA